MNKNHKSIIIAILVLLILSIFLITRLSIGTYNQNSQTKKIEESRMDEVYDTSHIDIHNTKNSKIRNGEKYNTANAVSKPHNIGEDYEIDDMKIYTKDGWCYIEFTLTNIGDSKCNDNNCSLHLTFYKDKTKTEYLDFAMIEIPSLGLNESKKIVSQQIQDFTIAAEYKIDY